MEDVEIVEGATRYRYRDGLLGIAEDRPLDFHSPYGCSKGAADQYVRDYARIYGLRTVVLRQSLHLRDAPVRHRGPGLGRGFCIAARHRAARSPSTATASRCATCCASTTWSTATRPRPTHIDVAGGRGLQHRRRPGNTCRSWTEFGPLLEGMAGVPVDVTFAGWRPGDQPVYVSDISRARDEFGWSPKTDWKTGVGHLVGWVKNNREMLERLF